MTPAELRARLVRLAAVPLRSPAATINVSGLAADRGLAETTAESGLHGCTAAGRNGTGTSLLQPTGSGRLANTSGLATTEFGKPLVPAAVLIAVVMSETPGILLTKRTSHLTRHAGQISFPGGRIDPEDAGPEAAALREAWEEIGLDAAMVEVLGRMRDHDTGTGYRITPVLGLVPSGLVYQLSPHEVDAVFELPMRVVLDPDAPRRQRQHVQGEWREYWVWPHPEHFIWGATAAILVDLAQRLRDG